MEGDRFRYNCNRHYTYFNPLPPHGGRRLIGRIYNVLDTISIHSLRMEGDHLVFREIQIGVEFQSTPSAWRETRHKTIFQ